MRRLSGVRDFHLASPCRILSAKEPQETPLPGVWDSKLIAFEQLVALRCLRPDKLVPAIHNYIMREMGKRYVEPQAFRLEPIFADSEASVPLIFVLSPGSDPMADLLTFAEEKCKRVEAVSLGQGQGPVAESWIKEAISQGFWVVLQNCHLAKTFLPRCARFITSSFTLAFTLLHSAAVCAECRSCTYLFPAYIRVPVECASMCLKSPNTDQCVVQYELDRELPAASTLG